MIDNYFLLFSLSFFKKKDTMASFNPVTVENKSYCPFPWFFFFFFFFGGGSSRKPINHWRNSQSIDPDDYMAKKSKTGRRRLSFFLFLFIYLFIYFFRKNKNGRIRAKMV